MFLAKLSTVSLIFVIVIAAIIFIVIRAKGDNEHLTIKNINEKYEAMSFMLNSQILDKKSFKKYLKDQKKEHKQKEKESSDERKKIFVLNFIGDIKASTVSSLREEITAILTVADKKDEVVIIIRKRRRYSSWLWTGGFTTKAY